MGLGQQKYRMFLKKKVLKTPKDEGISKDPGAGMKDFPMARTVII